MRNGLTEQEIKDIVDRDGEAEHLLLSITPDIMRKEEGHIAKGLEKYRMPSLGDLPREKPEGYESFVATQLNGMSTRAI